MINKKVLLTAVAIAILGGAATFAVTRNRSANMPMTVGMSAPSPYVGGVMMNAPTDTYSEAVKVAAPPEVMESIAYTAPELEYSAHHTVVVSDVSAYLQKIEESAQAKGGTLVNSNQNTYRSKTTGSITVRVPEAQFSALNNEIDAGADRVVDKSINTWDSSQEGASLEARLEQLKGQEAELNAALAEAQTAVERTSIKNKLDRVTQQIQNLELQQTQYTQRVQYATVSLTASDSYHQLTGGPADMAEQWEMAGESVKQVAQRFGVAAIWIVAYSVIWLPLVALLLIAINFVRRKK